MGFIKIRMVGSYPTEPMTAYWDGMNHQVMDNNNAVWSLNLSESNEADNSSGTINGDILIKAIAVAQDPSLAKDLL